MAFLFYHTFLSFFFLLHFCRISCHVSLFLSDAQTVIAFLKTYGLEDDFKVSLPGTVRGFFECHVEDHLLVVFAD